MNGRACAADRLMRMILIIISDTMIVVRRREEKEEQCGVTGIKQFDIYHSENGVHYM